MLVLKSSLLNHHHEIIFGFSTKIGLNRLSPYFFNMSLSVKDSKDNVIQNRRFFFKRLGLSETSAATQNQIHGDKITFIDKGGNCGESDALITDRPNIGLTITSADCPAIFLFDRHSKIIAAVHSGWRGTDKKIILKVLTKLVQEFNSKPDNIIAYIAPSISQKHYEVGEEAATLFEEKYSVKKNLKYLLDLKLINRDYMLKFGILKKNIQVSSLCSYEMRDLLYSYRRDGINSGRAIGVIAMKNKS